MGVRLFQVEPANPNSLPLVDVLHQIASTPLGDRNREVAGGAIVRVEDIVPPSQANGVWKLDFVRLRYSHGPGRGSANRPVTGFDMSNGDGFAEETAMLYCPSTETVYCQYNHFGVKDGAAASYFGLFGGAQYAGFEFLPILDDRVTAKLAAATEIKTVDFKIAPGRLSPQFRANNISIENAIRAAEALGAPYIEMTISVGHSASGLRAGAVRSLISHLQRMIQGDRGRAMTSNSNRNNAVHKAQVKARVPDANGFAMSEVLDLIAPTLRYDMGVRKSSSDLRFSRASRYGALEFARASRNRDLNP
jgi:hypothetical protein